MIHQILGNCNHCIQKGFKFVPEQSAYTFVSNANSDTYGYFRSESIVGD